MDRAHDAGGRDADAEPEPGHLDEPEPVAEGSGGSELRGEPNGGAAIVSQQRRAAERAVDAERVPVRGAARSVDGGGVGGAVYGRRGLGGTAFGREAEEEDVVEQGVSATFSAETAGAAGPAGSADRTAAGGELDVAEEAGRGGASGEEVRGREQGAAEESGEAEQGAGEREGKDADRAGVRRVREQPANNMHKLVRNGGGADVGGSERDAEWERWGVDTVDVSGESSSHGDGDERSGGGEQWEARRRGEFGAEVAVGVADGEEADVGGVGFVRGIEQRADGELHGAGVGVRGVVDELTHEPGAGRIARDGGREGMRECAGVDEVAVRGVVRDGGDDEGGCESDGLYGGRSVVGVRGVLQVRCWGERMVTPLKLSDARLWRDGGEVEGW